MFIVKSNYKYIKILCNKRSLCFNYVHTIYVAGSLVERMFGEFTLFKYLAKIVWQMNRSAKELLIVTTNLDGFSLANCRRFAKFYKLSTCQTFPLYGI